MQNYKISIKYTKSFLAISCLFYAYSSNSLAGQNNTIIKFNDIPKPYNGDNTNQIIIEGQTINAQQDNFIDIQGNTDNTAYKPAQVWYQDKYIQADTIKYNFIEDKISATSNVLLKTNDILINTPQASYIPTEKNGSTYDANYTLNKNDAHGKAKKIDLKQNNTYLHQATYTTCSADAVDWYIQAQDLNIDNRDNYAVAHNAKLVFWGIPILSSPYLEFGLNNKRRSGFLNPVISLNSRSGIDIVTPYYFNIAPQRDLTIYPRILSKRGLLLGSEFRYLGKKYSGRILSEYLPKDATTKKDRWALLLENQYNVKPWLLAYTDIHRVSDKAYPDDFGRNLSEFSQRLFTQEIGLKANKDYEQSSLQGIFRYKNHQSIADDTPYNLLPQFNLLYTRSLLPSSSPIDLQLNLESDASYFKHYKLLNGKRIFEEINLSADLSRLSYYIRPNIRLYGAKYWLDKPDNNNKSILIPSFSIDSAMFFERKLKNNGKQTLEPRLFYTNTPYVKQDELPLFDTTDKEFGLQEIFSNNRFIGHDRTGDANQITAGITSRWLDENGNQKNWITIAQRYQFKTTKVNLNNRSQKGVSDVLIQGGWEPSSKFNLSGDLQYNPNESKLIKFTAQTNWLPSSNKNIGIGYNYRAQTDSTNNTPYKRANLYTGWQLNPNWKLNSQIGYDVENKAFSNIFLGLDYFNNCWQLRTGIDRVISTDGKYNTRGILQIALKGIGGGLK